MSDQKRKNQLHLITTLRLHSMKTRTSLDEADKTTEDILDAFQLMQAEINELIDENIRLRGLIDNA